MQRNVTRSTRTSSMCVREGMVLVAVPVMSGYTDE